MRVQGNGNVGIGTTAPGDILTLAGSTNSYSTAPVIRFDSTSTANANIRNWAVGPADSDYGNFHIFKSAARGGAPVTGAGATTFTINYEGNVGIGTTAPSAPLDVWGSGSDGTALLRLTGSAGSQAFNWISSVVYPNLASGKTAIKLFGHSQGANNQAYVGFKYAGSGSASNTLTFGFYANNFLVNLLANGNFGIGTDSPSGKLHVKDGSVNALFVTSTTCGNVGIKTTSPNASLVVKGNVSYGI